MPIWKVSFTDGMFQVADADGALYPLTSDGQPLTQFNEGWSPRGLQTGLPPFHVLELEYSGGDTTIWLLNENLDYSANMVMGLSPIGQSQFFAVMDPIVRTLYAECVLAPHAAIPAAAHQFDGMLPNSIAMLTVDSIRRTAPAIDTVVLDQLEELGGGYGSGADALSADWIARATGSLSGDAQERFDLPAGACERHLDPNSTVFYLIRTADPAETSLFVPQSRVVFVRSRRSHDPLEQLIQYYAGHTNRAVSLPEALSLAPDMMVPPQHGLDEPPEPAREPSAAAETGRTVFEAPLAESEPSHMLYEPAADPVDAPHAHAAYALDEPAEPVAHAPAVRADDAPTRLPEPPRQNWWQRLLGLGNP